MSLTRRSLDLHTENQLLEIFSCSIRQKNKTPDDKDQSRSDDRTGWKSNGAEYKDVSFSAERLRL